MKCRNHAKKLDVTNETVSSLLSLMSVAGPPATRPSIGRTFRGNEDKYRGLNYPPRVIGETETWCLASPLTVWTRSVSDSYQTVTRQLSDKSSRYQTNQKRYQTRDRGIRQIKNATRKPSEIRQQTRDYEVWNKPPMATWPESVAWCAISRMSCNWVAITENHQPTITFEFRWLKNGSWSIRSFHWVPELINRGLIDKLTDSTSLL